MRFLHGDSDNERDGDDDEGHFLLPWEDITWDEALLWLNDRLGKSVHVSLRRDLGDTPDQLFGAEGELHHFQESKAAAKWREHGEQRVDLAAYYTLDGNQAEVDLAGLGRGCRVRRCRDMDVMTVVLTEDEDASIYLEFVEQRSDPLHDEKDEEGEES